MLVLTRKSEESVILGSTIEVKVLQIRGDQVSLGFSAPREISVHRKEVYEALQKENTQAVSRGEEDLKQISVFLGKQLFKARYTHAGLAQSDGSKGWKKWLDPVGRRDVQRISKEDR